MSYHTWVYKKAKSLTDEEKKVFTDRAVKEASNWWGFKHTKEEIVDIVRGWYKNQPGLYVGSGTPEEYATDMIKEFTERLDNLGDFDQWLKSHEDDYPTCTKYKGELYVNINVDYPFRFCSYSDICISSKQELLEFLQKQDPSMIGYTDWNDFIEGFTDELIKRIDDYFTLHGEDNLLFDFG